MNFKVGFGTDIGLKRQQNQDNGSAHPDLGLFIVADGMGGHQGGEIASAMAVEIITDRVREAQDRTDWSPREVLTRAIHTANQQIYARALRETLLQGMGTTATVALFHKEGLTIGHVGDSRCYYLRPGGIWQLTRDHSLVQEKLKAGLITREQMKTDRMRNVITRSVGFEPEVNVEIYEMDAQPGDVFLLCSDGLSGMIEDEAALAIVDVKLVQQDSIQGAVNELLSAANSEGGEDNVTAILVQVVE